MISVLIFAVLLLLFIFYKRFKSKDRRFSHWYEELSLAKHEAIFQQLYASVDGFLISKKAREIGDDLAYVYGEINFISFVALLSNCQLNQESIFYDLGSGTGKAVFACAMVYPVKKSCGIEILEPLYLSALNQQKQLAAIPNYASITQRIDFQLADIRNASFSDATHIFINATAFFGSLWTEISQHIARQTVQKTIILSSSKPLSSLDFECSRVFQVEMSWGVVEIFEQIRK